MFYEVCLVILETFVYLGVIGNAWTTSQHQTDRQEIDNENSLKRHFMTIHFKETIKPINLKEC